jgi:hypothetical protein
MIDIENGNGESSKVAIAIQDYEISIMLKDGVQVTCHLSSPTAKVQIQSGNINGDKLKRVVDLCSSIPMICAWLLKQ